MDNAEYRDDAEAALNKLFDELDQHRYRYDENGEDDHRDLLQSLVDRLDEVEELFKDGDFDRANEVLSAFPVDARRLERDDEQFHYSDTLLKDAYVDLRTALDVLDALRD